MKLTILGSCSGTEPMPDRQHTSFVVEHAGGVYWFDAGEGCSYTGHLAGIDILSIRTIFISHPHLDHVGGLVNLIGTMRKLNGRNDDPARSLTGRTVPVFIPNLNVWSGVLQVLAGPADTFEPEFSLDASTYGDGVIYDQNGLKVTAHHNRHLGEPEPGRPWQSYSFRIETPQKCLVFSGDVKETAEVAPLLHGGCDLFLMETGHHRVEDVCAYLHESGTEFGRLGFVHHGRAILADPEGECEKARSILGDRVFIADDAMAVEV